jgi:glycosyltransferase involved in cell wall biosynthesis
MRIMVIPHTLELGGSQLNAVELAAAVRDLGHDVLVFGRRGQLLKRIEELGLEFVESPRPGRRPTLSIVSAIARIVQQRNIDIIHAYEWPPAIEAELAILLDQTTRVMTTVMSMAVAPFIPRHRELVVGTEEIAEAVRLAGRHLVSVIEPPVDTNYNAPGVADGVAFRREWGVPEDVVAVVAVARMSRELKLEGTLSAIRAIGTASTEHAVRLILVGDGPARPDVETLARQVNSSYGPGTVTLTGELSDPRPAYEAADIALGMGGSALRAMAFRKPLIVQGERGFWRTLSPDTLDGFLWTGWYGIGDTATDGADALLGQLRPLLADAELRESLGKFGRHTAVERFSLARAALIQSELYLKVLAKSARRARLAGNAYSALLFASYVIGSKIRMLVKNQRADDFNAMPVTRLNADSTKVRAS